MQRLFEASGIVGGIEPARVVLAAQPGDLPLGELPRGEDGAVAEPCRIGRAVEVLPGLAITDRAECGQVDSATVVTDRDTGRSRGFGFVEMSTNEEAEQAISKFNGQEIDGREAARAA